MLVLSRRIGEAVEITHHGVRVVVTIVKVCDNGKVRLGIEAPQFVTIDREEIGRRKRGEFDPARDFR